MIPNKDDLDSEVEASAFRYLAVMNSISFKKLDVDYQREVYSIAISNYYLYGRARLSKCNRLTWAVLLLLAMDVFAKKEGKQCISMQLLYTAQQAIFHDHEQINKRDFINKRIKNWALNSFNNIFIGLRRDNFLFITNDQSLASQW
jgi:hypothetical protein